LKGGRGTRGGLVKIVNGQLSLVSVTLRDSFASTTGGCIHAEDATVIILGSQLLRCQAMEKGGAIYAFNSLMTISDSWVMYSNTSGTGGGMALVGSTTVITSSSITNNSAIVSGGGITHIGITDADSAVSLKSSILTIIDSTIANNVVQRVESDDRTNQSPDSSAGGGIFAENADDIILDGSHVITNIAWRGNGGGVATVNTAIHVIGDSIIADNQVNNLFGLVILLTDVFAHH
jgi:hypothetical protein